MKILLACPTRGSVTIETITRLEQLRDETPGLDPIMWHRGGYNVAHTRNEILAYAEANAYDVVAMVDDDVVPAYGLLDWADSLETRRDEMPEDALHGYAAIAFPHPVVDGADVKWSVYRDAGEELGWLFERPRSDGRLHACDGVATGAILLSLPALATLPGYPYVFRMEQDATGWRGEDLLLCRDLARAGFLVGYVHDRADLTDHYVHHTAAAMAVAQNGLLR